MPRRRHAPLLDARRQNKVGTSPGEVPTNVRRDGEDPREGPAADASGHDPSRACFVYLLRCGDGSLYCGWTVDLDGRLDAHRRGRGARYTRGRLPLNLVYWERWASPGEALRGEARLKGLPKTKKEALVAAFGLEGKSPSASCGREVRAGKGADLSAAEPP
ncbi:GIY-YIG nuclease family protein [Aminithiophilus ramosus]|uniref:GIY-YIG nuclease family protein n=1 Tax=Aminithiophilus ramosus TaxID=3029084 RepID=UPI00236783E3|nr:GIY-YIG nuclease family protein [Aminithiophilus ramosus]